MIVIEPADFANLDPGAAALFAAAGQATFFAQASWYDLMARYAAPAADARTRLYLASDYRAGVVCHAADGERLHGLSNAYSVEHGPITRPNDAAAADSVFDLAAAIAREHPRRRTIRFTALDLSDPVSEALRDGLRAQRWIVNPFFDFGTWFEDTRGMDFRRYFDRLPSILRNTYRRKAKAVAGKVDYRFESDSDIDSLVADYETVYRNSWKKAEPHPAFMPALIRLAASLGALRMGVARLEGAAAAAQFWIVWKGRAVIYKLAHDERHDKLSLGTILTMRLFERVLEQDRPDEINYGRGDDPYKRLWLPRRRERWGLLAANPRTFTGLRVGLRGMASRMRDRLAAVDVATHR